MLQGLRGAGGAVGNVAADKASTRPNITLNDTHNQTHCFQGDRHNHCVACSVKLQHPAPIVATRHLTLPAVLHETMRIGRCGAGQMESTDRNYKGCSKGCRSLHSIFGKASVFIVFLNTFSKNQVKRAGSFGTTSIISARLIPSSGTT